jgi:predicted nucleic-acid-binding protein
MTVEFSNSTTQNMPFVAGNYTKSILFVYLCVAISFIYFLSTKKKRERNKKNTDVDQLNSERVLTMDLVGFKEKR